MHPASELKAYAEHCMDKYDVRRRTRLNTKVIGATFDDESHVWTLETADGDMLTARFVVGATGVFTKPQPPTIPGLDDFSGTVMHTARWDHDVDLAREARRDHRHRRVGCASDPVDRPRRWST